MWGGADYERVAQQFASIHDDLVSRIAPNEGERWLDVGTGTGEVALRVARSGAEVTAIDISAQLLDQARAKPGAARVTWQLADAQALPFEDASFDGVVSCFAAIFAPDQARTAKELARVCRRGGRLGLTSWRPGAGPHTVYDRFAPSDGYLGVDEWGKEARVEEWLGESFELKFEERVWHLTGESPEAVYEEMTEGAPPVKALLETLDAERAGELRQALLDYWEDYRVDGGVDEPRAYLIVEGRRH
jgi:SAM-dependent methyltransferase